MNNEIKYLICYKWYSVVNYLIALGEQIALWNYCSRGFFWTGLVLNVLGILTIGSKITKLEKKLGLDL